MGRNRADRPGRHRRSHLIAWALRPSRFATAARALVVNTPDIGAGYFREVAAVVNAGGPPDRARLAAVMQRFGLVPAAPPGAPHGPAATATSKVSP